jgi:Glyoxalase superfamily protein/Clp amino terminal domain, pathogenicity island component
MQEMRDFRDAKAMAHTLRAALAAKGHKITISESLELIAQAFGEADWNTLSAAIRAEAPAPRESASPPPPPTAESVGTPRFSVELEATLRLAHAFANERNHEYATLEHLLLALIDDVDASAVMKACAVDLGALKERLTSYIDDDLKELVIDDGGEPRPTAGFRRVVQRAVIQTQGLGRPTVTGAQVLVGIFAERESHAAYFLQEQDMTRYDAINYISHGIGKRIVKGS